MLLRTFDVKFTLACINRDNIAQKAEKKAKLINHALASAVSGPFRQMALTFVPATSKHRRRSHCRITTLISVSHTCVIRPPRMHRSCHYYLEPLPLLFLMLYATEMTLAPPPPSPPKTYINNRRPLNLPT